MKIIELTPAEAIDLEITLRRAIGEMAARPIWSTEMEEYIRDELQRLNALLTKVREAPSR